ncbi:PAS domain S-box protein [Sphingomonas oryzagri]
MKPFAGLPLTHSWPLFECEQQFELGATFDADVVTEWRDLAKIGRWECDLRDNRLTWSSAVYLLFGLPEDASLARSETLPLYAEQSRVMMERLRAYAIRHRRGFTLDAELRPADGGTRWMRLIAAPIVRDGRVISLHGIKRDITSRYL